VLREEQIKIREKRREMEALASSLLNKSYVQVNLGDINGAENSVRQGLEILTNIKRIHGRS